MLKIGFHYRENEAHSNLLMLAQNPKFQTERELKFFTKSRSSLYSPMQFCLKSDVND